MGVLRAFELADAELRVVAMTEPRLRAAGSHALGDPFPWEARAPHGFDGPFTVREVLRILIAEEDGAPRREP